MGAGPGIRRRLLVEDEPDPSPGVPARLLQGGRDLLAFALRQEPASKPHVPPESITAKDTQRYRWVPGAPWGGNQATGQSGNQGFRVAKLPSCPIAKDPWRTNVGTVGTGG